MKSDCVRLSRWIASLAVLAIIVFLLGGCVPANHSPVITTLRVEREVVSPSGSCPIECVASDKDGDGLSYAWFASGGNIDGDGPVVNWSAPKSVGKYAIVVEVSDANGGQDTNCIILTVRANHPPTITGLVANKDWVIPSGGCQIECNAEDLDGDSLTYTWSASGGDISDIGSVVTWTAPETIGLYNIIATVTDALGGEDTSSLDISVALNHPPIIESLIVTPPNPKHMKEHSKGYLILWGKSCEIECVASDPDGGEQLNYTWSANGDIISEEEPSITWTAPHKGGKVTVAVTVSDSSGGMATKSIDFTVETCTCAFR